MACEGGTPDAANQGRVGLIAGPKNIRRELIAARTAFTRGTGGYCLGALWRGLDIRVGIQITTELRSRRCV